MGLLNIIHRMHKRQKLSIREIARLTAVSRNTVTKHLAANTIEPKFATPERASKLDPFAEKLADWLKIEAGKSRKRRRTVKQLHVDLVTLGFTGPIPKRGSHRSSSACLIARSIASMNSCLGTGRPKTPENAPTPDGY